MGTPDRQRARADSDRTVVPGSAEETVGGALTLHRPLWWLTFVLFAAAMSLWALSMPTFSSPDETAHVVKAAAVARGQLLGHDILTPAGDTITYVEVPAAQVQPVPCFAHRGGVSAACQGVAPRSNQLVSAGTLAGHYQPLYYAVVGLGSLAFPGSAGLYVMRLLSAGVNAFFLASALQSARAWRSGLGLVGVLVAVTPMVYFLGAGVNPSGLEITAAVCVWTSLLALFAAPVQADRRLIARVSLAASALVLIRGLSPLWLLCIAVVVVLVTGTAAFRQGMRRADVRVGAAIVLVATLTAGAWIVSAGALTLRPNRGRQVLAPNEVLNGLQERFWPRARQLVGVFGWLDTALPRWVYLGWAALLILLLIAFLITAGPRGIAALTVLLVAVVGLPAAIEASQQNLLGFVWQGRYTMPLAVGVPLLLAFGIDLGWSRIAARLKRVTTTVLVLVVAAAQVTAFWVDLRRYTVGVGHGGGVFRVEWSPPVSAPLLLAGFAVVQVALAVALMVSVPRRPDWSPATEQA